MTNAYNEDGTITHEAAGNVAGIAAMTAASIDSLADHYGKDLSNEQDRAFMAGLFVDALGPILADDDDATDGTKTEVTTIMHKLSELILSIAWALAED
jgi:HD-like signal output (HDOD) protein